MDMSRENGCLSVPSPDVLSWVLDFKESVKGSSKERNTLNMKRKYERVYHSKLSWKA
jgi:hypothetical protein